MYWKRLSQLAGLKDGFEIAKKEGLMPAPDFVDMSGVNKLLGAFGLPTHKFKISITKHK